MPHGALVFEYLSLDCLSVVSRSSLGEVPMRFRSASDEVPMEMGGNQRGSSWVVMNYELRVISDELFNLTT